MTSYSQCHPLSPTSSHHHILQKPPAFVEWGRPDDQVVWQACGVGGSMKKSVRFSTDAMPTINQLVAIDESPRRRQADIWQLPSPDDNNRRNDGISAQSSSPMCVTLDRSPARSFPPSSGNSTAPSSSSSTPAVRRQSDYLLNSPTNKLIRSAAAGTPLMESGARSPRLNVASSMPSSSESRRSPAITMCDCRGNNSNMSLV